ncbi:uncharacterized protein LOC128229052 [Mya arenaria]|uniref:uncharacterized protein LOC128229052 n=1 Tax=Mya arenaria TaxID=6604 RepID=UPI0022E73122|nr:uncharacterized protein LOC128229052 [Mya arenaria]
MQLSQYLFKMYSRILATVFLVTICATLNHGNTTVGVTTAPTIRTDGFSEGISDTTAGLNEVTTTIVQHSCRTKLKPRGEGETNTKPSITKSNAALLLLLGFGGFSILVAAAYKSLRKYVYHDDHNLDTVFDAGGRVSLSLTAVTVTSQLLWPADFLQSSTLTSKSGLGGTLWFSIGIIVDILLFPVLSIFLKTRAPGAKTFPQIAYARFGVAGHIMFCILAMTSSLIVCTSMLLAGKSALEVLTKDVNNEFIFLVLAFLFGSYCMIGGLGTTFYISYFNTALTFLSVTVYVLYTSYFPSEEIKEYSSMEALYTAAVCVEAPETNYEQSHATFRTESGLIYGVVLLFMATSISFTDQANWQSRIAAKPSEGVLGFFMAAYLWLMIAPCLSVTATTTYFAMSLKNGTHLLSESEIDNGYITPFVMNFLLGETGGYLLLTMLMMALMSTGSGEVMAISSIVVYDIYKTYINPFRQNLSPTSCVLCGRQKHLSELKMDGDFCTCSSSIGCKSCEVDITTRACVGVDKVAYTCSVHGDYRRYEDGLMHYKSWCMVWVVILIVPYGLLISETNMNVNWATLGLQILTCPFLMPLFLTITWSKATAKGVISGGLLGLSASISGMLIMGSRYEGGLSNFYVNTAQDYSLLTAMLAGFVVSGVVSVIVSLCTHTIRSEADAILEWAKTINIDNPINPFRLIYEEEFAKAEVGDIITAKTMDKVFRKAKLYAGVLGSISLVIFVVVIPAIALNSGVLSFDEFTAWIKGYQTYCFICTFVVVVLPPFEEGYQIWLRYQKNKRNKTSLVCTAKQQDLNGESCKL